MSDQIKWGILGPGRIAHQFARDIRLVKEARLWAVASRQKERAREFAQRYTIPKAYGSYRELVEDEAIDIVYIATPHGRHYEDIKLCLNHNKAVLCEKSFTLNARQAQEVINLARTNGLFLMEAMWTRFLPITQKLRKLLKQNVIGRLHMLSADLGFPFPFDLQSRLFNPVLGGGALLDVGVYPVSLSQWFLGTPREMRSLAVMGETGVDEQAGMVFSYANGVMAHLFTSIRSSTPSQAVFMGDKGHLIVQAPLYRPSGIVIKLENGREEYLKAPLKGNGFNYEISEATRCLLQGQLQSSIMPWQDTTDVMKIMDGLRALWGFSYPQESKGI